MEITGTQYTGDRLAQKTGSEKHDKTENTGQRPRNPDIQRCTWKWRWEEKWAKFKIRNIFFYFLRLQKFLFLSHPVSSPPKLLRINKAVMTAIVVQILQSWSLHESKVFFAVTVQRVQFNSLIIFLVEGVAGGQSDQCRSWRNSRWPWSGVNFTISLTHQIFSSASVPLWNHSHWRPRGGRARDMITNTHYHQELCVSHLTLTLIPSRL